MSDELLPYYNRELAYFRKLSREFAEQNPKIAGRLRLGSGSNQDPHVERLIEAFAFLNARTRHKIDDEFPEISDAFLNTLYPHFLSPIPSMAIVQMQPDDGLGDRYDIPRETQIETEHVDGEPCRFRTVYPVELWPLRVTDVTLARQPMAAPTTSKSGSSTAVLRWKMVAENQAMISELAPKRLRVYLNGPTQHTFHLYELLFNNTLEIAVAKSADDPDPIMLPLSAIRPVGFDPDEGMLPYPARSSLAYRLLSEFYAFPEKFMFFDVMLPSAEALAGYATDLHLYFYLNRTSVDLEQNVTAETFALGCAPMVNLFRNRAEPLHVDGTSTEYRIEPDARHPNAVEIYSIDHVVATDSEGDEREVSPLYSIQHATRDVSPGFWHTTRRPMLNDAAVADPGTDMFLSLVEPSGEATAESGMYVDLETTCFNRNLPNRLPFGGNDPVLRLTAGGSLGGIRCLTAPTPTRRPAQGHGAVWRLISHLQLGHLPLVGGPDGAAALREILSLYNLNPQAETKAISEMLLSVDTQPAVSRVSGGVCRGVEVTLEFESRNFSEHGLYLFANVLDQFVSQHASLNSFTQLVVRIKDWDTPLAKWPPRSGRRVLR